jgi:putative spermidine/putrescine transport system substrate-binding protein
MADRGITVQTVIPADGSIYAPSALMLNGYNTAEADLIKAFSDWVLSDQGQEIFAAFGARPIRYVLGDLELSDEAKANWLSDDLYANVQTVDLTAKSVDEIKEIWEAEILGQ